MDDLIETTQLINAEISRILIGAVNRAEDNYRTQPGFIRWDLVEKDIHAVVNKNILSDEVDK